jgi:hypothetical protein
VVPCLCAGARPASGGVGVAEVLQPGQEQVAARERLDLGAGERPGAVRRVLVGALDRGNDQQRPAGRDQLPDPGDGRRAELAGERLNGQALDHQVERPGPGGWWVEEIGDAVVDRRVGEAATHGGDGGGREVEGNGREPKLGQVLRVPAHATTHDHGPPPLA